MILRGFGSSAVGAILLLEFTDGSMSIARVTQREDHLAVLHRINLECLSIGNQSVQPRAFSLNSAQIPGVIGVGGCLSETEWNEFVTSCQECPAKIGEAVQRFGIKRP